MGTRHSINIPKEREAMRVYTEEPRKLKPERRKTNVNYNATVQRPTGEGNEKLESPSDSLVKLGGKSSSINKAATINIRSQLLYKRAQLPHYLIEILKEADSRLEIDKSSTDRLYEQLYNGVHLKQNKQKYWIDRTNKANCFMLYAEDLSITWGKDNRYWNWVDIKETSDENFIAAELKSVCWLEVCGSFDTAALTPETLYEVVFVVKIKENADGLESITVRLIIPNKSSNELTVNLMNVTEREKWIEVPVGEFFTSNEFKRKKKREEIEIFLYETEKLDCKQGLVIKGIVIRPKA
ncbi:hypothetical protein T459_04966 [Capsicum annuum]|uniref:Protein PHLOEM PROTEIN 2-LIKE A1-like n=1 Tax=Capsicum annuum TaxID=4072 RepID=A0A1U8FIY7_CAPAN|nr:protein PHLOEM PROTEIN 2-LIKE A1 [Capsicum annuum]KAF3638030.1 putative phosphatase IMPL1, chloroplastic-like isoform 1 [Capsicum annuum]PHT89853.1 hypothetical protein T459_04966 [Capsicum annuum]